VSLDDRQLGDGERMMDAALVPEKADRPELGISDARLWTLAEELARRNVNLRHRQLDPSFRAAAWVIRQGGTVLVGQADATGPRQPVKVVSQLPSGGCRVVGISLRQLPRMPDGFATHLALCDELESLDLSDSQVTSQQLAVLGELSTIKSLNLTHTKIDDTIFPIFESSSQLEVLDISHTNVAGSQLGPSLARQLRELKADHTRLNDKGMERIAAATNLQLLSLDSCRTITDAGFSELAKLTSLKELNLAHTYITGKSAAAIGALKSLQSLNLADNAAVDDNFVASLPTFAQLVSISLDRTKITNAALGHVARFPNLRRVDAKGTSITDAGASQFRAGTMVNKSPDPPPRDENSRPGRFGS
jgi:hypothetical protein